MKDFGAIAMEIKRKFVSLVINKYIVCLCKSLFLDWVLYLRECKRKKDVCHSHGQVKLEDLICIDMWKPKKSISMIRKEFLIMPLVTARPILSLHRRRAGD